MYCKYPLRLMHHTHQNLNEFRVVVSQVQRCCRLAQDMKGGRGRGGGRSSVVSITMTLVKNQDPFHFVPIF